MIRRFAPGTSIEFKIGGESGRGERQVVGRPNELSQVGWFGFMEVTMSNRHDFEFCTCHDTKPSRDMCTGLICECLRVTMRAYAF